MRNEHDVHGVPGGGARVGGAETNADSASSVSSVISGRVRHVAIGIAVLLATISVERVDASTCNGSSDSSSDSSSSDSSSDDSSSSSSSEATPACVDSTDVHGYRQCKRFGQWGKTTQMPPFIFEFGLAMRQFASPLRTRSGSISHDSESFSYRVVDPSPEASLESAALASLRVGMALRHGFYAAGEFEGGALTDPKTQAEMTSSGDRGTPEIEQTRVTMTSFLAVGGFRTRLGALGLGVEAAGGFRVLGYEYASKYHACETTLKLYEVQEVLEARARAQYFVSPFLAIGATYGKSLVDDAWIGGLYLGGNTRAFGGH
jgi:hypothetical protein